MDPLLPADVAIYVTDAIPPPGEVQRDRASLQTYWHPDSHTNGQALLKKILAMSLILTEDWINVAMAKREELESCTDSIVLLERLVAENLLTAYQAARLKAGKLTGLILGN